MRKDPEGIVRKRSLIEKAKKNVFLWVGGAASVLSAVVVISSMLVQAIMFNRSVLDRKNETLKKIEKNIEVAPDLKADISKLDTNQELRLVRPREDASALQTILDALPADENRLALGASIQKKIFEEAPGVRIDALSVDPAGGIMTADIDEDGLQQVTFAVTVSGSPDALKKGLQRLERSIRAFNITTMNGSTQDGDVSLQINGVAYYFPPANLELTIKEEEQK
ncbi:hypothetical protein GX865_02420 [Candidatus Saccharibacteria bacterium]|jgi:hypothetical protein|nr:hypothetical protein [Candidatus Saccharibacteria bacterium]